MPYLTITTERLADDGDCLLLMKIEDVDPEIAYPAIVQALRAARQKAIPRKPRSDIGKARKQAEKESEKEGGALL